MSRIPLAARRPRSLRAVPAALAAVVLLGPSAASADPRFAVPSVLRASSASELGDPAVGVSRTGRVVVAWGQRTSGGVELVARRGTLAGRFGATQRVARDGFAPSAATDRSGRTAVAWQRIGAHGSRRVEVAVAPAGRRFRSPQVLTSVRASLASLRVLASGDRYVVVWSEDSRASGRRAVRFAVSDATGRFGRARTLVDDVSRETATSAAVGPDGTVAATWATPPRGPVAQHLEYALLLPRATTFAAPVLVRTTVPDVEARELVAVGGPAGVTLAWVAVGNAGETLRTAFAAPQGRVAPAAALTFASDDRTVHSAGGPTTASPAAGAPAVAAWTITDQTDDDANEIVGQHVLAATTRPDGTYAPPVSVDPGRDTALPAAGATASASVLTWRTGKLATRQALRYAVVRLDGTLGPARTLDPRAPDGAVVASSRRAVVVAWKTARTRPGGRPGTRHGLSVAVLRDR